VLFIAADDTRAAAALESARFFAPDLTLLDFPAWDCLPYDRVSPRSDIESRRLSALAALSARGEKAGPGLLVTTINAVLQRVAPREFIREASFLATAGKEVDRDALTRFLVRNAYSRTGTVREPGEYALRGGIVDLWPPGASEPLRLDFFGPQLETIRRFDAETQLTTGTQDIVALLPATDRRSDSPGTITSESPAIHTPSVRFGVNRTRCAGVSGVIAVGGFGVGAATAVSTSSSCERPSADLSALRGRSSSRAPLALASGPVTPSATSRFQPSGWIVADLCSPGALRKSAIVSPISETTIADPAECSRRPPSAVRGRGRRLGASRVSIRSGSR